MQKRVFNKLIKSMLIIVTVLQIFVTVWVVKKKCCCVIGKNVNLRDQYGTRNHLLNIRNLCYVWWLGIGVRADGVRFVQILAADSSPHQLRSRPVEGDLLTSLVKLFQHIALQRSWRDGFVHPLGTPDHTHPQFPTDSFL